MNSPLETWHQERGGVEPSLGVPSHYGDAGAEYAALTDGAGLVDRTDWRVVRLTGPDRLPFLHKYCTQDVRGLEPGTGAYACCLTVKGGMVSDLWVFARADDALCLLTPAGAEALPGHLSRFALFDQVELVEAPELCCLWVGGDEAGPALEQVTGASPPSAPLAHVDVEWRGATVARDDLRAPAWWLLLPVEQAAAAANELVAAGVVPVGRQASEQLRVEEGRPVFGVDMVSGTIPLEAGLEERAISYDKGCYIGQEVIARIAHRGHINKHLRAFKLPAGAAVEPTPVYDDKKQVGAITSVIHSPRLGDAPLGLGIVHRKRSEPGSQVFLSASDGPPAQVCGLPIESSGA